MIQYDINRIGIKYDYLIGLLDGIIGWDYWIGLLDMVFLPNTGSVVVRSSQGRFFCFCGSWPPKGHILYFFEKERDAH